MRQEKISTRQKLLRAAEELAAETGAGHLSLEAVAARAGVSKGGLLYHFRSKAELLEAMVADYMERAAAMLGEPGRSARPDGVLSAYLDIVEDECRRHPDPPAGLLAALAEDPGMLDPLRRWERDFLARIRANASDPALAALAFLAMHGLRNMRLLNIDAVDDATRAEVLAWLRARLAPQG
ncbi:TetR/AcrR family transcriptional regulator [Ruixingdingia sedimenti]|uniref:TetR/AcrR family transcriptional regulator n=1 Tax=Ruixingdingia sedimenti TaxID=3073604 RepID=A0ABU1F8L4_9RHOB|nr:TetR/AcrR family transcriptional regulator [Xinfangfangia sp. LG-4]MDR5653220.1 TetR/AcrR family transcriptional regulator [Xinfangfangia sp. LG-4]